MGNQWRTNSKCNQLTPEQSDKMFFPNRGGKSKKAKDFCSNCPVLRECLQYSIANNLEGFFAGETQEARREMAGFMALVSNVTVHEEIPEPEKKRKVYRKIVVAEDPHEWLDKEEPSELELAHETPVPIG